jgi:hypothetical protein
MGREGLHFTPVGSLRAFSKPVAFSLRQAGALAGVLVSSAPAAGLGRGPACLGAGWRWDGDPEPYWPGDSEAAVRLAVSSQGDRAGR